MKRRGRPVLGAFSGLFAGLFLGTTMLFYGVIPLDSNLLVILPIGGLVLIFALAMWAPIGRGDAAMPRPAPVEDATGNGA